MSEVGSFHDAEGMQEVAVFALANLQMSHYNYLIRILQFTS